MGYTRYWTRTEKPMTDDFIILVNDILLRCRDKGITIRNGLGEDKPIVTKEIIAINGDAERRLDHESFVLDDETGLNFCKTAMKPYDYAVKEILKAADDMGIVTRVSDDGEVEVVSDEEYLNRGY